MSVTADEAGGTVGDPWANLRHNAFTPRERKIIARFLGVPERKVEAVGYLAWQKSREAP